MPSFDLIGIASSYGVTNMSSESRMICRYLRTLSMVACFWMDDSILKIKGIVSPCRRKYIVMLSGHNQLAVEDVDCGGLLYIS
jgi:hypothetical protein